MVMLMNVKLIQLMLLSSLTASPTMAQSLNKTMQKQVAPTSEKVQVSKAKRGSTTFKLNPSNKFNVAPNDVYNHLKNARNITTSINKARTKENKTERIAAQANVADSLILYGLNYSDGTWQTLSPLASKVYSFQAAPVINYTDESSIEIPRPMAAFYAKGKFYALNSAMDEDGLTNTSITTYDAETWQELGTKMLAEKDPTMEMYLRQIGVYDPTTDKAYTMSWGDGKPLISIDLNTMETKNIGQVNLFIQTLFVDNAGQLYGIAFNDKKLYKINKENGTPTEVGELDVPHALTADQMSAVCDPATGKVYWVGVNNNSKESALYTIDLNTAHTTKIADLPGDEHFLGLYLSLIHILVEKVFHRFDTWKARIDKFLDNKEIAPEDVDLDKDGQTAHANIAIASSNVVGKGPGNSVERDFLSQAFSDFIYAIIIEEMGIAGAAFVCLLYIILLFRTATIANRCVNTFPALLIMGFALLLVIQAMFNMAVAVGLVPVTGQPLPLISKGGTSTIVNCVYIGIILSVSYSAKKKDEDGDMDETKADKIKPAATDKKITSTTSASPVPLAKIG